MGRARNPDYDPARSGGGGDNSVLVHPPDRSLGEKRGRGGREAVLDFVILNKE